MPGPHRPARTYGRNYHGTSTGNQALASCAKGGEGGGDPKKTRDNGGMWPRRKSQVNKLSATMEGISGHFHPCEPLAYAVRHGPAGELDGRAIGRGCGSRLFQRGGRATSARLRRRGGGGNPVDAVFR